MSARSLSLQVGTNPNLVGHILSGRSGNPTFATLEKLAEALGTTVAYLQGDTDDSKERPKGFAEPEIQPFHGPDAGSNAFDPLSLAPGARHPSAFTVRNAHGLIATGPDAIVVVDLAGRPGDGDLVLISVVDESGMVGRTKIGRLTGNRVVGLRYSYDSSDVYDMDQRAAVMGPVVAVASPPA